MSSTDLCGADCSGSDMSEADFTQANIRRSHFIECFPRHGIFVNSDLSGSDFRESDLTLRRSAIQTSVEQTFTKQFLKELSS
jgi:uncharacterized protein YjbI with pentapeptide repeats